MSVRVTTLANGMRIVTEDMPGVASASVGVWVRAGSRHERAAQNGIAHFLEHMAFKGTTTRSALQIAEQIEDVGGMMNAYTGREMTAYYARVLGEDVPLALDVIGDVLVNSIFDPQEIEVERGVILQEIGQANDTPDDIIFDWLQEVAFPDQPLGRTILGPAERVAGFGRADLTGFVQDCYAPDRMILAAAGAIDHDAVLAQARALFDHLPARPLPTIEPARFAGGEWRQDKTLEQVHFALAFEQPGYNDPDVYTSQVFATAFGGGMSSRLFQEAREKRGLCYTIFAQAGAWSDTGLLTLYAGTGAAEIGGLAELTIDELKRAADDMSESEAARARAQLRAGLLMGLEGPGARAERLARMLAIWDRIPEVQETLDLIDAVTGASLRDHAGKLITRDPALALYGPAKGAPDVATLARRLAA